MNNISNEPTDFRRALSMKKSLMSNIGHYISFLDAPKKKNKPLNSFIIGYPSVSCSVSIEGKFLAVRHDSNNNILSERLKEKEDDNKISIKDFNRFEKIYEDFEKSIKRMKLFHLCLILFSVLSILFAYIDNSVYNKNSEKFLIETFPNFCYQKSLSLYPSNFACGYRNT